MKIKTAERIKLVCHVLLLAISLVLTSSFLASLAIVSNNSIYGIVGAVLLAIFGVSLELMKFWEISYIKTFFKKLSIKIRFVHITIFGFATVVSMIATLFSVIELISPILYSAESFQSSVDAQQIEDFVYDQQIDFYKNDLDTLLESIESQSSLLTEKSKELLDVEANLAIYRGSSVFVEDSDNKLDQLNSIRDTILSDIETANNNLNSLYSQRDFIITELQSFNDTSVSDTTIIEDQSNTTFSSIHLFAKYVNIESNTLILAFLLSFIFALEVLLFSTTPEIKEDKTALNRLRKDTTVSKSSIERNKLRKSADSLRAYLYFCIDNMGPNGEFPDPSDVIQHLKMSMENCLRFRDVARNVVDSSGNRIITVHNGKFVFCSTNKDALKSIVGRVKFRYK